MRKEQDIILSGHPNEIYVEYECDNTRYALLSLWENDEPDRINGNVPLILHLWRYEEDDIPTEIANIDMEYIIDEDYYACRIIGIDEV